jgi:hypothetical protein
LVFSVGSMIHGKVPADGTSHFAVNEGQQDTLMILIEITHLTRFGEQNLLEDLETTSNCGFLKN